MMLFYRVYRAVLIALGLRRRRRPEAVTIHLHPYQRIGD